MYDPRPISEYRQRRARRQDGDEPSFAKVASLWALIAALPLMLGMVDRPFRYIAVFTLLFAVLWGLIRWLGREKLQALLDSKVGIAIVILLCAAIIWGKKHGKPWAQPRGVPVGLIHPQRAPVAEITLPLQAWPGSSEVRVSRAKCRLLPA